MALNNPYKRHIEAVELAYRRVEKRAKTQPTGAAPPTAPADASEPNHDGDPKSSELSESSEEPSDESSLEDEDSNGEEGQESEEDDEDAESSGEADDANGTINLRANRGEKPIMKLQDDDVGEDIRPFLKDFLPKLKAANEELETQRQAGTLRTNQIDADNSAVGEDGQYIEMVGSWLSSAGAVGSQDTDGDIFAALEQILTEDRISGSVCWKRNIRIQSNLQTAILQQGPKMSKVLPRRIFWASSWATTSWVRRWAFRKLRALTEAPRINDICPFMLDFIKRNGLMS